MQALFEPAPHHATGILPTLRKIPPPKHPLHSLSRCPNPPCLLYPLPAPTPECKVMYILHLSQIFFRTHATYFYGSGSKQVDSPVLTSNHRDQSKPVFSRGKLCQYAMQPSCSSRSPHFFSSPPAVAAAAALPLLWPRPAATSAIATSTAHTFSQSQEPIPTVPLMPWLARSPPTAAAATTRAASRVALWTSMTPIRLYSPPDPYWRVNQQRQHL